MVNYVTITEVTSDGSGTSLNGTAVFVPSATVYVPGAPALFPNVPVLAEIVNGQLLSTAGGPLKLLATDNTGLTFVGLSSWFYWTVTLVIGGQTQPSWYFDLPSSPTTRDLFSLANTAAGGVTSVTAGDASILIGGAGTAPTVETGTLDRIAALHPAAAAVGFNGQKATGLANGSVAADAVAYGQLGSAAFQASSAFDAGGAAAAAQAASLPKAGGTMTGWLAPAVVALTFGTSIAVNAALGNVFAVTLTSSAGVLANPANPVDGQTIRVRVIQDATGGRTLAYGTAYDFGTAGAPTLSTAAGKVDLIGFEYVASLVTWVFLGSALGN